MASPTRIASALRYIAQKIDNSDRPSRSALARELGYVILSVRGIKPRMAAGGSVESDPFALPPEVKKLWDSMAGRDLVTDWNSTRKEKKKEMLPFHLRRLKDDVGDFLDFVEGFEKLEDDDDEDVFTSAPPTHKLRKK
jgi:hypothetical protein